jgi:aminoglycoside phosphotransferase (APT) family kinase protein
MAEAELAASLGEALAELGGDSSVPTVSRIPGGASRETWLVESGDQRYVLRRDPAGAESLTPQAAEFRLLGLARDAGVPVAEPLLLEADGGRFGTAGMLMAYVAGESVGPRVLRSDDLATGRELLPVQLGEALARIHSIDPAATGLPAPDGDPILVQLEHWEKEVDRIGEPLPVVELGLRWLRANRPEAVEAGLVHGDFRLGNFIVDENGLAAVIDWELAHLGDPVEDIGWLCIRSWRFGSDDRQVAGVGSLDQFLQGYEAGGGTVPDPDRIRFWEVFGNLKWAVICARQANDHLTGLRRSHELASLGRRICEPEWDMLELIS